MSIQRRPRLVLFYFPLCALASLSGGSARAVADEAPAPDPLLSPFLVPDPLSPLEPGYRPAPPPGVSLSPFPAGSGAPRVPAEVQPAEGPAEPPTPPAWERVGVDPRKVKQESAGKLGTLTSQVVYQARTAGWNDPPGQGAWKTDEAWKYAVAGPLFVFGQLKANSDEPAQQDMKVTGHTGLACKLPVGDGAEVQVRSGPGVSYTDPLRPVLRTGKADWVVEVQARCPLLFGIGLEYQGTAAPALNPTDKDSIDQDLRLAMPVGNAGKFQFGARHRWQNTTDPRPTPDSMQLYLGLELAH